MVDTQTIDESNAVLAWHFLQEDRLYRYKPRTPVVAGKTYTHNGEIELCESGLHASIKAIDAVDYAPGPIVCRVACFGSLLHGDDKLVCTHRKVLWMADASRELRLFACDVAEEACKKHGVTDERSLNAIAVSRRYAHGEATAKELAAAWDAACAATWAASRAATWAASRAAAWAASRAAAWAASRAAVCAAHNEQLTARLLTLESAEAMSREGR